MKTALVHDLQEIIDATHTKTWEIFDVVRKGATVYGPAPAKPWKSPGEPAFVSTLLESAVNSGALRDSLLRHLSPKGLCSTEPLISGIFIHQKPKIEIASTKDQIELGDLLLVRHHFKVGAAKPEGRAVLLQAKSGSRPTTGPLRKKEATQFGLYSDWSTKFRFPNHEIGSPPDGSGDWDFSKGPGHYAASGEYGLVSNLRSGHVAFPDRSSWAVGNAMPPPAKQPPRVTGHTSLAEAFAKFLVGGWGRQWDIAANAEDHWSSFIKECLAAAVNWRRYPIDRLGAVFPRRRDLVSLCYALAHTGAHNSFDWQLELQLPRWLRVPAESLTKTRYDRVCEQLHLTRELMREAGGPYNRLSADIWPYFDWPPYGGPPDLDKSSGPRGISVLYVATSGSKSLDETHYVPTGEGPEL